ncbi:hypothetical protein LXM94_19880, partial [Rhizobium sp. TRM95111]|nr:hypothetical protein [Rhizobium alarense]
MTARRLPEPGRRAFLALSASGLATLASGCTTFGVLAPEPGSGADRTDETLALINALRAGRGLPALGR